MVAFQVRKHSIFNIMSRVFACTWFYNIYILKPTFGQTNSIMDHKNDQYNLQSVRSRLYVRNTLWLLDCVTYA